MGRAAAAPPLSGAAWPALQADNADEPWLCGLTLHDEAISIGDLLGWSTGGKASTRDGRAGGDTREGGLGLLEVLRRPEDEAVTVEREVVGTTAPDVLHELLAPAEKLPGLRFVQYLGAELSKTL